MHLQVSMDGTVVVKADVDAAKIGVLIAAALRALGGVAKSPALTVEQVNDLLSRINPDSRTLLRKIGENNGSITWPALSKILGYTGTTWSDFSNSHNRGINTALSKILDAPGSRLIHWDDDEEGWTEDGWPNAKVYIDGEALRSIRIACGLETA